MRLAPSNIAVIGDEFAVAWNDGTETFIPLEALRRACPCASCQGEPDGFRPAEKPVIHYRPESFLLSRWTIAGAYAIQPVWGDGHSTGLYSFDYLKKIGAAAAKAAHPQ